MADLIPSVESLPGHSEKRSSSAQLLQEPLTRQADDGEGTNGDFESISHERNAMTPAQRICLDLVVKGCLRSFTHFFTWTVTNEQNIQFSEQVLKDLEIILVDNEHAHRSGDSRRVYGTTKTLSSFFLHLGLNELAIKYYQDALQFAKNIQNDQTLELEAVSNLGMALETSGKLEDALDRFTLSKRLAIDRSFPEEEVKASQNVIRVLMVMAEQAEKEGLYKKAVSHYSKCLEYAGHGIADESSIANIQFRLGNAYRETDEIDTAIQYLEGFLEKVKKFGDKSREGQAQAALASCYERSGNAQLAASYLQQFVTLAEQDPNQTRAVSQACNQLGLLYNKLGQYNLAVQYFERHFNLMNQLKRDQHQEGANESSQTPVLSVTQSQSSVIGGMVSSGTGLQGSQSKQGAAEVQLGISKGNALMKTYFDAVTGGKDGLSSLLTWKSERSFGGYER